MWEWLRRDFRVAWLNFTSTRRVYVRQQTKSERPMTPAEIAAVDSAFRKFDEAFRDLDRVFGDDWKK